MLGLITGTVDLKVDVLKEKRIHIYEGGSYQTPIEDLKTFGVDKLIVLSAVGAINDNYKVGDIVIFTDSISLFYQNPTNIGFVDTSELYSRGMNILMTSICETRGTKTQEGIHCFVRGPQFETPQDKRILKMLGADVVGMSTLPEALYAKSLGMDVLGIGLVTNLAFVKHSHDENKDVVLQNKRKLEYIINTFSDIYDLSGEVSSSSET